MGWSIGYDARWDRDIGYGVPAYCDHPDCYEEIDRGLAYVCCNEQPYGGEDGCGLYFCFSHRSSYGPGQCARCSEGEPPFPAKHEHPRWLAHRLSHESWERWRTENPERVAADQYLLAALLAASPPGTAATPTTETRDDA